MEVIWARAGGRVMAKTTTKGMTIEYDMQGLYRHDKRRRREMKYACKRHAERDDEAEPKKINAK